MKRFFRLGPLLLLAFVGLGSAPQGSAAPQELAANADLRDFESWEELTPGPYRVPSVLSTLCAPHPAGQTPPLMHPGEPAVHDDHFIRVYADPQALSLMRSPRGPKFPVGSRIAKVKLREGSDRPDSVAFMVKREAGYNPASLDWEFLFFDGQPLRQTRLGPGARCQECHGGMVEGDGVYGSYLPERQGGTN